MSGDEIRTARQAREVLDLPTTAGLEETRLAFRAAVRRVHPDRGGDAEALRRVIDAHRLLVELHDASSSKGSMAVAPPAPRPRPRPVPKPLAPLSLEISAAMAVLGGARAVRLPDGRRGRLKLPPGLRSGDTVRLATRSGPILMSVTFAKGEYEVRGDDLWADLPVSPHQLEDGGVVEVDTLQGRRSVGVAPGATVLRLQGQGLPPRGERPQGHLFLRLIADPSLGRIRARDLLRRFTAAWAA